MTTATSEKKAARPGAGGFRHTVIGQLLREEDYSAAAKALRRLFVKHVSIAAVARAEGTDRSTVERWVKRLGGKGHDVRGGGDKAAA